MQASEVLIGSSMSNASKDFIGTTSPKIWSPFEKDSYKDEAFDSKAKYLMQVERKAGQRSKSAGPASRAKFTPD